MADPLTPDMWRSAVLSWAGEHRRDLPWRRTRDPWRVLVSEVMLQQTQVDRVVPRWERFVRRWPTTSACAAASLGDVLAEWQGLGYPRRARSLHAAAQLVETRHGGRFPGDLDALLQLPGVGPYTARAVLAFAFERDVAVVDTNVGRILARRHGGPLTPRQAQAIADAWVPAGHGWEWNQGLLDVGADRCRPRAPGCAACPLAPTCTWHLSGHPEPDPAAGSASVSRPQRRFEGSVRQARGRVLAALVSRPLTRDGLLAVIGVTGEEAIARVDAAVDGLLADGLVERGDVDVLRLPA